MNNGDEYQQALTCFDLFRLVSGGGAAMNHLSRARYENQRYLDLGINNNINKFVLDILLCQLMIGLTMKVLWWDGYVLWKAEYY